MPRTEQEILTDALDAEWKRVGPRVLDLVLARAHPDYRAKLLANPKAEAELLLAELIADLTDVVAELDAVEAVRAKYGSREAEVVEVDAVEAVVARTR